MTKITIEDMKTIAEQRGGKCLSEVYINYDTKLRWQCKEGHIWDATVDSIKQGCWCPKCGFKRRADMLRFSIEDMHILAKEKGGRCFSEKYVNTDTKLKWQCKEGHIWEAIPYAIKRGQWCPKCFGNAKLSIEEMQKIAKEHGGKCLSEKYENAVTKLKWQCKEGHVWHAVPASVKNGYWCPKCGWKKTADSKRLNIKEMQDLAKSRGGVCLSKEYVDAHTKLKWQCEEGHIWEAEPGNIKYGQWCPICQRRSAGINQRLTLGEMRELADKKGGKCLSTEYHDSNNNLRWQCKELHIWEATPSNIKRGTWCPICSENVSERICRRMFENIFHEIFPKSRPKWLMNPGGRRMELDGYCEKLRMAFEYQGVQHYKYVPRFHQTRSFERQKTMDELKRKKCKENNVILFEIPYPVDYEQMPAFIIQECKKRNIKIPEITKSLDYKLMNIYSPEKLKEMQQIAKEKGGLCLSKKYINNRTKLKWQCKEGHIWEAIPNSIIQQNSWCPYCGGSLRLTIEQMQEMAKKKNGICLSKEYVNNRTKLRWQCREGHIWETKPVNIQQGKWCPYCAGIIKLTIEEMKTIAEERGGKCLSEEYNDNRTKLKWQCKEGHIWEANPCHIKRGEWCPKCARLKIADALKGNIEEYQEIAKSRGGLCLSTNYVNAHRKLRWQCKEGHVWEATPGAIKHGRQWCPVCAKKTVRRIRKYNRNYKQFPHKHIL